MGDINSDLAKPYVNVHQDNEHIDSYYSRTLGSEPHHPELDEEVKTPVCVIGGGMAGRRRQPAPERLFQEIAARLRRPG